jgi:hypothetical protein
MTLSITQPSGPLDHPAKVKIHQKDEPPQPTQIVLGDAGEASVDEEPSKSCACNGLRDFIIRTKASKR